MSHPVLKFAAAGFLGLALWKIASILLLPFLASLLGIFFTVVKVALLVGLVFLVYRWFRKKDGEAPAS